MRRVPPIAVLCSILSACSDGPGGTKASETGTLPADGDCDPSADSDGDGLDDCTEEQLGTDPTAVDSDGDGISDPDELDCVSDPLDAAEQCYACGWAHNNPGTLTATGAAIGDTVEDLTFIDQCGDDVRLWDFAGSYTVAFLTAAWCPLCKDEASAVEEEAAVLAGVTGQSVNGLVILFESQTAGPPTVDDTIVYAQQIGAETMPVLADPDQAVLSSVPYDGSELPGVCLLGPDMTILYCGAGQGQLPGLESVISTHAAP